jgi:glucose-1-phosphate cytidylyltransferase
MKAVILAGGVGSRLSEETILVPKPMVQVGSRPILWHIMNVLAAHHVCEFVIALGYKAEVIKEYFLNFYAINNDISVDLSTGETVIHNGRQQPKWRVHLVDTGLHTQTGGRLRRLRPWLANDDCFIFTYGDGVADLNVTDLVRFHREHGRLATVTAVKSPARFGRVGFAGDNVTEFYEKAEHTEGWINGGFFVLSPGAIDYIKNDETVWELDPVERLAHEGQLVGYRHSGFWSCMDTLKEKNILEEMWQSGSPPWKTWS